MKIINIFGVPYSGAVELANSVWWELNRLGFFVGTYIDSVPEYYLAEDFVTQSAKNMLALQRLDNLGYEVAITNRPFILPNFFYDDDNSSAKSKAELISGLKDVNKKLFYNYSSNNYLVIRHNENDKTPPERIEEFDTMGDRLEDYLTRKGVVYTLGVNREDFCNTIVNEFSL